MKPYLLPVLIGLLPCLACVQPASHWETLQFHDIRSAEISEGWTFGEVTGVTPETYEVSLDRDLATTPGGSVRFEGKEGSVYHTIWTGHTLPTEQAAFLLELTWDQYLEDASEMPLVWVRLDGEEHMIGMTDSRSLEKNVIGSWESCSMKVAVPIEARDAVIGVGMMGQGVVRFDNLKMRMVLGREASPAGPEARAYVDAFLAIVEEQAMMTDNLDWPQMRRDMASLTAGAVTTADTYPALRFCLNALGDNHSRLLTPAFIASRGGGDAEAGETVEPDYDLPQHEPLDGDLGYLWLPGHLTFGEEGPRAYASTLARALEELKDCKGFVIDLRQNGGGNMWPMLAGLGPLLGAEVVGSFTYPDGSADTWWFREDVSGQSDIPCTEVIPPHGASFPADIPVALLTSRWTGSSGESTLIAFLGRPNVRTFGQPTTGLSTGNSSIPLSDGAILLLTTSVYADRTGKEYGGRVTPDEEIPPHGEGEKDAVLQAAVAWLQQQ